MKKKDKDLEDISKGFNSEIEEEDNESKKYNEYNDEINDKDNDNPFYITEIIKEKETCINIQLYKFNL